MHCVRPTPPRTTKATVRFGSSLFPPVTSLALAPARAPVAESASRPAGKTATLLHEQEPPAVPGGSFFRTAISQVRRRIRRYAEHGSTLMACDEADHGIAPRCVVRRCPRGDRSQVADRVSGLVQEDPVDGYLRGRSRPGNQRGPLAGRDPSGAESSQDRRLLRERSLQSAAAA